MRFKIYRILLFIWTLISIWVADAQELHVKNFYLAEMDISAVKHPRFDLNGRSCALIKVGLGVQGAKFPGPEVVGDVKFDTGEYWVYVVDGTKKLKVMHNSYAPLYVDFSGYPEQRLEGGRTYVLILSALGDVNINNDDKSIAVNKELFQKALKILSDDDIADKKEAITILKELSPNYVEAKNKLAYCYRIGFGVERNFEMAADLYKESSKLHDKEAMEQLALLYLSGQGVVKDVEKGISLLKEAAIAGSASSMTKLGEIYLEGKVVDSDEKEAFCYFSKAAEENYPEAYYGLGRMYHNGFYVDLDIPNAVKCYKQGAELGCSRCMNQLGQIYSDGISYERKVDMGNGNVSFVADSIPKDITQSVAYFQKAIERGNTYAMNNLSTLIFNGEVLGFSKDYGFSLLKKSAEMDNPIAQYNLAGNYMSGKFVKTDRYESFKWLKRAAENGERDAIVMLSQYIELGCGTLPDIDSAVALLKQASEMNDLDATFILGIHYDIGLGVTKNPQMALELYKKAAPNILYYNRFAMKVLDDFKNNTEATPFLAYNVIMEEAGNNIMFYNWLLGYIYANGIGVVEDVDKAVYYYDKASQLGDARSKYELALIYSQEKYMSEKQIDEKIIGKLIEESAETGFAYAEFTLGLYYDNGMCGFETDQSKALQWYEKASKHGYKLEDWSKPL